MRFVVGPVLVYLWCRSTRRRDLLPARKLVVSTYLQYIIIAAGAVLLVLFVRQIGGVLLTFLMAAVLAYALNPLVRRLEAWRIPRVVAVLGVFTVLILAVAAALLIIIVPATHQVQTLVNNPEIVANGATQLVERIQRLPYVGERIAAVDRQALLNLLQKNMPSAGTILQGALGFIGGVFGVFGTILNLFLMLIVSIYLLLDRERIFQATLAVIPATVRDQTLELFREVEETLVRYLKAQMLLCAIMGVIGWAIVFFTGGRYALLIGVWVGITELIPVLGAFLGATPAVILALLFSGPLEALIVAGLFLVAQQLEGNLLVPRIMGGSVGVHPLWVLFAMLSATALYGLIGALFAVPVVAIVSASLRYLRRTLIFERWRTALVFSKPEPTAALESAGVGTGKDAESGRK